MSIHEPKPLSSTREKKRQDFSHQDKYNQFFRKLYPFPRKITNISLFCLAIISLFCNYAPYLGIPYNFLIKNLGIPYIFLKKYLGIQQIIASREEEIAAHGKPVSFRPHLHRSRKDYNRDAMKKAITFEDDGFFIIRSRYKRYGCLQSF